MGEELLQIPGDTNHAAHIALIIHDGAIEYRIAALINHQKGERVESHRETLPFTCDAPSVRK